MMTTEDVKKRNEEKYGSGEREGRGKDMFNNGPLPRIDFSSMEHLFGWNMYTFFCQKNCWKWSIKGED